jgi:hypothetical protein
MPYAPSKRNINRIEQMEDGMVGSLISNELENIWNEGIVSNQKNIL